MRQCLTEISIDAVFCRRYGRILADYFQPLSQNGFAVLGGVEIIALTATLAFEERCSILSYDGDNFLQQHTPRQVPSSASGNHHLSGLLRSKPVRTEKPKTIVRKIQCPCRRI